MTDTQELLAEYVKSGSEAAFRELVARYIDLVYSTALRLVDGDSHQAQDVAQTVFVDLAQMAKKISTQARLGGWLHRHTCFVAAKTVRAERRRQRRERQAVEMNAPLDHSEALFRQAGPLLDEAINRLGAADRTAVLMRSMSGTIFAESARPSGPTRTRRKNESSGRWKSCIYSSNVAASECLQPRWRRFSPAMRLEQRHPDWPPA